MAWVRFLQNHSYTPARDRRVVIAYKAGMRLNVPRACADAAVDLGRAELVPAPTRAERDAFEVSRS